ncbi:MAG: FAD-dependent oxidoreductase [Alphaproteobacteria bacterium]|nr:FAD-dependent oxidoreductase [Alphaproteobacteria bacterium]
MAAAVEIATRIARIEAPATLKVDIAVLGAGIAGVSAAIEAARLGRRTALIDGAPVLGGQAVGAQIGTFCGFYSNGPKPYPVTYGIAAEILRDLGAGGHLNFIDGRRRTRIVQYDDLALGRWIERAVAEAGVVPVTGAVLTGVVRHGRRIEALELATRYGSLRVLAHGFVDASGDAALAHTAQLSCREPAGGPLFGSQMLVLEGVDGEAARRIARAEFDARLRDRAQAHGLVRRDGFAFPVPGRDVALLNMTHTETPLDPVAAARAQLAGRDQADRVLAFMRAEFPHAYGRARVRSYGLPGIRMTRWIVGRHQLTDAEVRAGHRHADAVARCSWPIELHHRAEEGFWEEFGDDHMHYVPLGSLVHAEADNLAAAGRCIDGQPGALSSVRVMGPCIATGAAAAHALVLAGAGSLHQIDVAALQARLRDNLERTG